MTINNIQNHHPWLGLACRSAALPKVQPAPSTYTLPCSTLPILPSLYYSPYITLPCSTLHILLSLQVPPTPHVPPHTSHPRPGVGHIQCVLLGEEH